MALHLQFAFSDNHYSLIQLGGGGSFPAPPRTAGEVREYLARKFEIPASSLLLYSRPPLNDQNPALVSDSTAVPTGDSTWYWSHLAEEPSNWPMKRERSMTFIEAAVKQLTEDMKMSLFGLYKEACFIDPDIHPRDWDSISEPTIDSFVDWHEADWETKYEAYHEKHKTTKILVDLYRVLTERLKLLTEDLYLLEDNLKALVGNDAQLMQTLKMELSKTVTSFELKSIFSFFKRWEAKELVAASQFNSTQSALSFNFQASHYEVQKVSGMYVSLKAERCRVKTFLSQLRTHRLLFALRGYLIQVLRKDFSYPLKIDIPAKIKVDIKKYKIERSAIQAAQACVSPCCDMTYCSISYDGPSPGPSAPRPVHNSPTTFIQEMAVLYPPAANWKAATDFAVPYESAKHAFQWISSSVSPDDLGLLSPEELFVPSHIVAVGIKDDGIYVVNLTKTMRLKKQTSAIPRNTAEVKEIKRAILRLLHNWQKHNQEQDRAYNYTLDVALD